MLSEKLHDRNEAIRQMAYAIERKALGNNGWSDAQFIVWCHKDPVGKRSFRKALGQARAAYKVLATLGVIGA